MLVGSHQAVHVTALASWCSPTSHAATPCCSGYGLLCCMVWMALTRSRTKVKREHEAVRLHVKCRIVGSCVHWISRAPCFVQILFLLGLIAVVYLSTMPPANGSAHRLINKCLVNTTKLFPGTI